MANKRTKEESAVGRFQAAHAAGDFRAARALARSVVDDPAADEAARAEARKLLARTSPDPRALTIAIASLALAALVILIFLGN